MINLSSPRIGEDSLRHMFNFFFLVLGKLSLNDWAESLEQVLQLKLPWILLSSRLVQMDEKGEVFYLSLFQDWKIHSSLPQVSNKLGPLEIIL